jgi:V/A-type H+-transporting ATPase subunit I
MIVPMKKASFVIREKDNDTFLKKLRDLGVIHLEKKRVSPDSMGELLVRQNKNRTALGILARYPVKKGTELPMNLNPAGTDIAGCILDLYG